jgi:hypothetical protein
VPAVTLQMMPARSRSEVDGKRLLVLAACVGLSIAAWELPFLAPLKLLAVAGHETGHAVASLIVGGSVDQIHIQANEGGDTLSMIPDGFFARVLVSSAGYVGAAIIGAVLLLFTFRFNLGRVMLGVACGWLALIALLYARDPFTLGFCLGMAALFGLSAKFLPLGAVQGVNLFIASFTALYSVMDLKSDLWSSEVRARSDAAILASTTGVPAMVWAVIWTALSLAIVGYGAYVALRRKAPPPIALPRLAGGKRGQASFSR